MAPTSTQDPTLELIYSIRALAQTLEIVHEEMKKSSDANSREHEHILNNVQGLHSELQLLPINISDRSEKSMDKRLDAVLDDVRKNINEIRNKLWSYMKHRKDEQHLTPLQGTPILQILPPAAIEKPPVINGEGLRISWDHLKKIWSVSRWVLAALAASGGIFAFVRAVITALR